MKLEFKPGQSGSKACALSHQAMLLICVKPSTKLSMLDEFFQ